MSNPRPGDEFLKFADSGVRGAGVMLMVIAGVLVACVLAVVLSLLMCCGLGLVGSGAAAMITPNMTTAKQGSGNSFPKTVPNR